MRTELKTKSIAAATAGFEEQTVTTERSKCRASPNVEPERHGWDAAARETEDVCCGARRIAPARRKRWAGAASPAAPTQKNRKGAQPGRKAVIEATKRRGTAFREAQSAVCLRFIPVDAADWKERTASRFLLRRFSRQCRLDELLLSLARLDLVWMVLQQQRINPAGWQDLFWVRTDAQVIP